MLETHAYGAGESMHVPLISGWTRDLLGRWAASRQRARTLREIASMDAGMLRDLGLSHHEAVRQMAQRRYPHR